MTAPAALVVLVVVVAPCQRCVITHDRGTHGTRGPALARARSPGAGEQEPACAPKCVQGWPQLWADFRALIGIFGQSVGPSLAIWASPVQLSFAARPDPEPLVVLALHGVRGQRLLRPRRAPGPRLAWRSSSIPTAATAAAPAGAGAAARRFHDGLRVLGLAQRLARAPNICRALVTCANTQSSIVAPPSDRLD